MDIRPLTPGYAVSPQIDAGDLPAIAAAGFTTVICNRPDTEVGPDQASTAIRQAAEAAGLTFSELPLVQETLTPENASRQRELVEAAGGPVLAYCRSGTRCTVIWALGQAGRMPTEEILQTAARAGYQLDGMRPALEYLAKQG
ncbi:MAG: TIGR01244 family sulfur transferase [Antarcticimicrobium sp.]|uniref:TIGR01244 family sulfur transferase n=1 Tax=Antarcticimicrobium sp. TaxID=2824147 RepID=UPI002608CE3A|nr:TIGR01244 family sulfur transferase [Antarcticimicrobium sp.]MDF1716133.1 TIGR01244 family sulfur transferase [Antarcticimicrobium sp.]